MSIKFKPDSTLSAEPFPSAPAEKNIITLLGVQGLSHNDYSIVELKVMLQLIKHAQKVIVNYVIPQRVSHNGFYFTSEQLAAGHTIVEMKLSELDITGGKHCAQLRQVITQMPRKPIELPFKVGNQTGYRLFDCLFESEVYKNRQGRWMAKFIFGNNQLRFFYSFSKGASKIDLNVVQKCKSASSIKLYLLSNCWAMKGYTMIKPENLMALMHGRKDYYASWSELERKTIRFACKDLKRLYNHHIIDFYLTYQAFFREEGEKKHHHMPDHITFTLHDRRSTGDTTGGGKIPDELVAARIKLKIRLILSYKVEESCAIKLSNRLSLDMLGELNDWFIRKDYYLHKCEVEHKKIRTGAYIAKALDGFFKDHHA